MGYGIVLDTLEHLDFVWTHPRVSLRADDGVYLFATLFLLSNLEVLSDIPLGAFVSLTEECHDIGYRELLFRLHGERKFFGFVIEVQRWCQLVEDEEFANAECLLVTVCLPELERFLAIPEAETLGYFEHVFRSHVVVLILQVQGADTRDVGRYAYVIVWNTNGCPYTTNLVLTFAEDFEVPYFVRVGNGETFATIGITVLLDEFAHELDGFASGATTLESHTLQFFDHEHTVLVLEFTLAGDGCFANTQLLFVHTRIRGIHECVCVACLRNLALYGNLGHVCNPLGVHTAIVDSHGGVAFVGLGRNHVYPCAIPAIASVAGDDRAIGGCILADHDRGTAFRIFLIIRLSADG